MIHVGCSGFYYPDWVGRFYPKTMKVSEYLHYYSKHFNTVEINSTFYNYPKKEMIDRWIDQFSRIHNFLFSFKFPKQVTHGSEGIDSKAIDIAVEFENDVLSRFSDNKLLGAGLIQFSPYFEPDRVNDWNGKLSELIESLNPGEYRIALELRNRKFLRDENIELLSDLIKNKEISLVTVDSPGLPFFILDYSKFYYIRLHGRNSDLWYGKAVLDGRMNKYDYLYSRDELKHIMEKIKNLKNEIYIYFNNHAQSKAAINAMEFSELLGLKINAPSDQKSLIDY
ncbi:MAG: DUF72 domain-containing protein [Thermoplasmata archaeon]